MRWNWQDPDWPALRWDKDRLAPLESRFLHRDGVQLGAAGHVDDDARQGLIVEILTGEALDTSRIEGEILNRDSVRLDERTNDDRKRQYG